MKVPYITKRFNRSSREVITLADRICSDYARQGLDLTLRQLYYQFVARDLIPNRDTEYKRLGSILNDARLAGEIDWSHIVDRTRYVRTHGSWTGPEEILESCAAGFRLHGWRDQPEYVEVWIEKDALVGVIQNPCNTWRTPYFACRGYASVSEIHSAAGRLIRQERLGRQTHILHLGDHDPSGIDMTRDIEDRLRLFGSSVEVTRLALNMDQVEEYAPPPNPAKMTDSRSNGYVEEFGYDSWELDALNPTVLQTLVEDAILAHLDRTLWDGVMAEEEMIRGDLSRFSNNFAEITNWLDSEGME